MRFTYLFFSLLLCLTSYAQPNPINRRAMAIAGLAKGTSDYPITVPGLAWRWRADLSNSNLLVNWIDDIQSDYAKQPTTANQATNSANGVGFDGNRYYNLTNGSEVFDRTNQLFVVFVADTDAFPMGLVGATSPSTRAIRFDGPGAADARWLFDVAQDNTGGPMTRNAMQTFLHPNSAGGTNVNYTNGISTTVATAGNNQPWGYLGGQNAGGGPTDRAWKGYIAEIDVYTNDGWFNYSSAVASNFNYYATNKYKLNY